MNRKTLAIIGVVAVITAPIPAADAVTAAAVLAALKPLIEANKGLSEANKELNEAIQGEVNGLNQTVSEQLTQLNAAMVARGSSAAA